MLKHDQKQQEISYMILHLLGLSVLRVWTFAKDYVLSCNVNWHTILKSGSSLKPMAL